MYDLLDFDYVCAVRNRLMEALSASVEERGDGNLVTINKYAHLQFVVVNTKPTKVRIWVYDEWNDELWDEGQWIIEIEPYYIAYYKQWQETLSNLAALLCFPYEEDDIDNICKYYKEEDLQDALLNIVITLCENEYIHSNYKLDTSVAENDERDSLFCDAARFIANSGTPRSILELKDHFNIDHNRVWHLYLQLEDAGIISLRPNRILVDKDDLELILNEQ